MRIRALNCFLKFQGISDYRIRALRLQQKKYTDYIISQADYEYLKRRLREDEQYTFYFIIRFITATGVRVSELISFQIQDVINGYKDIYSKGNKMRRVYIPTTLQEETVVLLSQQKPDDTIEIDLDLDELDATSAELKATYQEIKDYVLKEFGLKVSSLYISQVKRKCGIEVGENYNLPKSENARVPQCPKEKEDAIKAALKYYAMI